MEFLDVLNARPSYSEAMGETGAHIRIKLDTHDPVALSDFIGNFVGIGSQFEKYVAEHYPQLKTDSEFFVKEVRAGCIEADLIAWAVSTVTSLPGINIIDTIDKGQILTKFVGDLGGRLRKYFVPGGRDVKATKSDLADYHKALAAIARDPNAGGLIEAAVFETDGRNVRSAFKFTALEAREGERQIAAHRIELETTTGENQDRVLLKFVRPSIEAAKPGKKDGERAIVASMRERGGRSLPFLCRVEGDAVPIVRDRVGTLATIYADEGTGWDALHAGWDTHRVNHSVTFMDKGVCTNQAESFFSRLRRMEVGTHHYIAGPYLQAYAGEAAWREDHRRAPNGEQASRVASAALTCGQSRKWAGYWQRAT
ncbi:transposase [Sphingomonas sp.]|uniref:transposase n=1 Tax=Sphingomonas sp. TaxID=28214 RepID=UPI0025E4CDF4|nr:transposase [Sphingomonas sp.]